MDVQTAATRAFTRADLERAMEALRLVPEGGPEGLIERLHDNNIYGACPVRKSK